MSASRIGDRRATLCALFWCVSVWTGCSRDDSGGSAFEPTQPFARRSLSGCSASTSTGCVTVNDGAPAETRYTLFSAIGESATFLVDGSGNLLNSWQNNGVDFQPLPEAGRLLTAVPSPGPLTLLRLVMFRTECVAILDWHGGAIWPNQAAPGSACFEGIEPLQYGLTGDGLPSALAHHDVQLWGAPVYWTPQTPRSTGDGRVLFIAHADLTEEQSAAVTDDGLIGEEPVVEMAADGETVLWEWIAAEHIDEMGFDAAAREAISLFASGFAPPAGVPAPPNQGWLLINAASYLGPNRHCPDPAAESCDQRFHPDNVLIGSRQGALMFIVARSAHPRGTWSEGAVVWRIGPNFEGTEHGPISGAHHPHMIPVGLPGEGNVLVFDNGSAAGFGTSADGTPTSTLYNRGYSRILEIDPVTGELVWMYEQPTEATDGTPAFNAFNLSSAQRLENGNTLVDEGNTGRLFEVNPDGEIVWEFVSPFDPLFTANFDNVFFSVNSYRAYRVPPHWVLNAVSE